MSPLPDYDSPSSLRAFLEERGMAMQKKFGQNFLVNRSSRDKLIEALNPEPGSLVWEVGPGLGAMTRGLLDAGVRVCAFEIDRGFSLVLKELFADENSFTLVEGDALKTVVLRREQEEPDYFFGNLPYNIAASLIAGAIEKGIFYRRQVITVQKEVARRMAAEPGTADYSSISVLVSSFYKTRYLGTLRPGSFWPQPHVDSGSLLLELRDKSELDALPPLLQAVSRALFEQRRKMIANTLERFCLGRIKLEPAMQHLDDGVLQARSRELARNMVREAGLLGSERVEKLAIVELHALARAAESCLKEAL